MVGPVVGVLGALQADLALSLLDGDPVEGTLVTFDGRTDALRRRTIPSRDDCPLCGGPPSERIDCIDSTRYMPEAWREDATPASQIVIEG